jgi:hypothetical protein
MDVSFFLKQSMFLAVFVLVVVVALHFCSGTVVLSDCGADASKVTSAQSTTSSATGSSVNLQKSSSQEHKNEHSRMYTECTHILEEWKKSCIAGCDRPPNCDCANYHTPYRQCCHICKATCAVDHSKLLMDKCMTMLWKIFGEEYK